MISNINIYLTIAASFSLIAALLHFSCLFVGAPLFQFLGAGDLVVKMVERGHPYPMFVATFVGSALLVCAAYAYSAAGLIMTLPWQKFVLVSLTIVLFARALAFPYLKPMFAGNSAMFWWLSSGLCFIFALLHAIGLLQVWGQLK